MVAVFRDILKDPKRLDVEEKARDVAEILNAIAEGIHAEPSRSGHISMEKVKKLEQYLDKFRKFISDNSN